MRLRLSRSKTAPLDAGLQLIAAYEAALVQNHDDTASHHVSDAETAARERQAVVVLAATIGERLREEYRARQAR